MGELKKLEFKKAEIEPPLAEPVRVELGGDEYTAHCPNDYEFFSLLIQIKKLEDDPIGVDFVPIINAFFDTPAAKLIEKRLRGSKPKINLIAEMLPCFTALVDHYHEPVKARLAKSEKNLIAPKAQ